MKKWLNNNKLYFAANDGQNGMELWTSDGTTAGTSLLKDIVSGSGSSSPEQLKVCGDKFYFIAKDPANTSRKALFVSNGTSAGTIKLVTLSSNLSGIMTTVQDLSSGQPTALLPVPPL